MSVYSASKGAVDPITKCLSKELGHRKIRVNSVNSGMVEIEGVHSMGIDKGEFCQQVESKTHLKELACQKISLLLLSF